jgi:hypothetical protein
MRVVHRIVTSRLVAFFAASLALTLGCAQGAPPPKHPLRPISEKRAAELIARVFREAGLEPENDRYLRVYPHDKRLRLEVAAAGRHFGVAYLTAADWDAFSDVLPPHPKDDSLAIGAAEGNRFLVLFAADYAEDDLAGDEHTATTIATDRRLARDVRDFVHRAEQQRWP